MSNINLSKKMSNINIIFHIKFILHLFYFLLDLGRLTANKCDILNINNITD